MRSDLLIVGRFVDDSHGVLARVQRFTLVLVKLFLEVILGSRLAFKNIHRSIEVTGAGCANSNRRRSSKPLDYTDCAFCHVLSFTHGRKAWLCL